MRTAYIVCLLALVLLILIPTGHYLLSGNLDATTCALYMIQGYACQQWKNSLKVDETYRTNSTYSPKSKTNSTLKNSEDVKLILAYTNLYGKPFDVNKRYRWPREKKKLPNLFDACEHRCRWSTSKSDYAQSDAVLFHLYNNLDRKDFVLRKLPKRHNPDQRWILMIREPQAFYYPNQLKLLNNMFNLSATFHSASDIHIPYGSYRKLLPEVSATRIQKNKSYLAKRSQNILWMVSNCITSSRREEYVRKLIKYIDIDIVGECNIFFNGSNNKRIKPSKIKTGQYKFYLAFENSDCEEYITEKFWKSLYNGMIPIVRGSRVDYKKFAPPQSYIHADSFIDAESLAEYLKLISQNATLFDRYHKWRQHFAANSRLLSINRNWMCDLCEQVHVSPPKTVDVYDLFSEDVRCFTYQDHNGRNRTGEHVEDIDRV